HGAGRVMSRTKAAGKRRRSSRYGCPDRDCDSWVTPQEHDQILRQLDDKSFGARCPKHPTLKLRKFSHSEKISDGLVDWPAVTTRLRDQGIELRGAAADEAPEVYKNLDAVIAAHPTIEVMYRLYPLGVVMAGPDT